MSVGLSAKEETFPTLRSLRFVAHFASPRDGAARGAKKRGEHKDLDLPIHNFIHPRSLVRCGNLNIIVGVPFHHPRFVVSFE